MDDKLIAASKPVEISRKRFMICGQVIGIRWLFLVSTRETIDHAPLIYKLDWTLNRPNSRKAEFDATFVGQSEESEEVEKYFSAVQPELIPFDKPMPITAGLRSRIPEGAVATIIASKII